MEQPQGVIARPLTQRTALARLLAALLVLRSFFGEIPQEEIGAEGPHHMGERVGIEPADELGEPRVLMGGVLVLQADVAAPQGLDRGIDMSSRLGAENVA